MQVPLFRPAVTDADVRRVVATLRSGWLTSGPRVEELEREFTKLVGSSHAVATSSGTAAIHLALAALDVKPGDLVLVPTLTFVGTTDPVRWLGARAVLVDCDARHLGTSIESLTETLDAIGRAQPVAGSRPPHGPVRAIVPVHFGGLVGSSAGVAAIARARGLVLVDDCAHAVGARSRSPDDGGWRHAGRDADASCFSFYSNKPVTTGEGGMTVTDDAALADRMRRLALHGIEKRPSGASRGYGPSDYRIVEDGLKCNMSDLAASLGIGQVERAEELQVARASIAMRYHEGLAALGTLELPEEPDDRRHGWHLYVVRLVEGRWRIDRDRLARELFERGIETSVHYRPLHRHPAFASKPEYAGFEFERADMIWPRLLSLPIFPGMSDEEIRAVIEAVGELSETFGA